MSEPVLEEVVEEHKIKEAAISQLRQENAEIRAEFFCKEEIVDNSMKSLDSIKDDRKKVLPRAIVRVQQKPVSEGFLATKELAVKKKIFESLTDGIVKTQHELFEQSSSSEKCQNLSQLTSPGNLAEVPEQKEVGATDMILNPEEEAHIHEKKLAEEEVAKQLKKEGKKQKNKDDKQRQKAKERFVKAGH